MIEQLKKFRNSVVSGNRYSDYENNIPLFLNGINVGSYSGMNLETASLDATILQLETNFERLLFSIHSKSIEIQQLAQSLAYDTRDNITLLSKASNKLYSKTLAINSKIYRLETKYNKEIRDLKDKITDMEKKEKSKSVDHVLDIVKKLQYDVQKLKQENISLKARLSSSENNNNNLDIDE